MRGSESEEKEGISKGELPCESVWEKFMTDVPSFLDVLSGS